MPKTQVFTRQYYERTSIWAETYWNEVQLERTRRTVALLPSDVGSVLDVGCGAGIVTQELLRRFPCVLGLDFAFEPLCQVKEVGIYAIQGDACAFPFPEKTFDAIVATELIEHLSEPARRQALNEMVRVARRYILLTVPYREVLEGAQVKCGECGCIFHAYRHAKSFNEAIMASLFDSKFKLAMMETLGPRVKRTPRPLVMLAQIFGGYTKVDRGRIICPQCGNTEHYVSQRRWMTRMLLGGSRRLLPLPRVPKWMAALYENHSIH